MLLNSEALLEKLVLGSSAPSRIVLLVEHAQPDGVRLGVARAGRHTARRHSEASSSPVLFSEWAVLTDKKTIPDDLLVREFTMVSEVGGNA